jgi:hypothetical protein
VRQLLVLPVLLGASAASVLAGGPSTITLSACPRGSVYGNTHAAASIVRAVPREVRRVFGTAVDSGNGTSFRDPMIVGLVQLAPSSAFVRPIPGSAGLYRRVARLCGAAVARRAWAVTQQFPDQHLPGSIHTVIVSRTGRGWRIWATLDAVRPAPCRPSQLAAAASLQGATGSAVGAIVFSGTGSRPCVLRGWPRVRLTRRDGRSLGVWTLRLRGPRPSIVLASHGTRGKAYVEVWWMNFCRPWPRGGVFARVTVPRRRGSLRMRIFGPKPRCDFPRSPSTLGVGTFRRWGR